MEGGLPSTETVLGMVAAGLTIALVDPVIEHRAMPGVVFRQIEDREAFTESGVIYRRDDLSLLLASFLNEIRLTPRRLSDAPAEAKKTMPGARKTETAPPKPRAVRLWARRSPKRPKKKSAGR